MNGHDTPSSDSLATRIDNAEQRLLERRQAVGAHGSRLSQGIHERITSPAVLGSAVGVGFLLGYRSKPGPDSDHPWLRIVASSAPWMHTLFKA